MKFMILVKADKNSEAGVLDLKGGAREVLRREALLKPMGLSRNPGT